VCGVYTGINGFDRGVGFVALDISADYVFAKEQGQGLLEMKGIFDYSEVGWCSFLLFLFDLHFLFGDFYLELFVAIGAFEYKHPAWFVCGLVKGYKVVALWASDAFHGLCCWGFNK
jgi:hypothetical protein